MKITPVPVSPVYKIEAFGAIQPEHFVITQNAQKYSILPSLQVRTIMVRR